MVDLQMHFPKYEDFTLNNKTSLSFSVRCGLWHSLFIVVCGTLLFQACFAITVIPVIRPESRLHTTIQGPDEMFGARVTCDVK